MIRFETVTILVTGASGHVGANLVRTLVAQGKPVRALLHIESRAIEGLDVETVRGDVREPESLPKAFEGVEMVYNLAANISLNMGGSKVMESVNVTGTRNVVEACLRHRVKRMVHFSSIHALAHDSTKQVIDESCPLVESPDCSSYSWSKAASENEVYKGIERGLNAVIIRPTAILGPYDYQPSLFGEVLLFLAQGKLPGLVAGGFDWVDVRDVVCGAIQAGETAAAGSKYLLSGHWATLCDVAAMVEEITGVGAPGFKCPLWLAGTAAPFVTAFDRMRGRRPLYTSFSIKTLRTSHQVSHARASQEFGYQPRPLPDSIKDTLEWFRETGQLDCSIAHLSGSPK
jgi:dihydroflavonol-4-reductase